MCKSKNCYFYHIFVCPGDAPGAITQNVAWMKRQFSARQTPHNMYLSIFNSFRVIQCLKSMRKSKNCYFYHIFVCPGDAPVAITQNVAWMKRQFSACQTPHNMYLSIFNSFQVIQCLKSMCKSKNCYFYHIFVCPGNAPVAITQNVVWMKRQFSACQTPRSMYLSIFNSFRVLKSMRNSKNRYFYHILVSPGDAPGAITLK